MNAEIKTIAQVQFHSDQVSAARKEFLELWYQTLEQTARDMNLGNREDLMSAQHCCWKTWLHAKGLAQ